MSNSRPRGICGSTWRRRPMPSTPRTRTACWWAGRRDHPARLVCQRDRLRPRPRRLVKPLFPEVDDRQPPLEGLACLAVAHPEGERGPAVPGGQSRFGAVRDLHAPDGARGRTASLSGSAPRSRRRRVPVAEDGPDAVPVEEHEGPRTAVHHDEQAAAVRTKRC